MGITIWPMTELEADDALASAAHLASLDEAVAKVCIWTPDKDLAQCVEGDRVVQVDRRTKTIRAAAGVRAKFGVEPMLIPDFLALVGDAADGYPGIAGIGAVGAARLLNRHGPIEAFPPEVLGERSEQALLFKQLATLRRDEPLFHHADELRWHGPREAFNACMQRMDALRLVERSLIAYAQLGLPRLQASESDSAALGGSASMVLFGAYQAPLCAHLQAYRSCPSCLR